MRQSDIDAASAGSKDHRSTRPGFRADIEGLRAVAVMAVVLFHAMVPGVGGGFVTGHRHGKSRRTRHLGLGHHVA